MNFQLSVGELIKIGKVEYEVAEHPSAKGIPYGQEGRQGIVYQLLAKNNQSPVALKIFRPPFRRPGLVRMAKQIKTFAEIPGLLVCDRQVINPHDDIELLSKDSNNQLLYAVVMPWIEGPTWTDIVAGATPISKDQSITYAYYLSNVLSDMEQQGIAHGDLSGANLIMPIIEKNFERMEYNPIELVDVEQLYAPGVTAPFELSQGSPGYSSMVTEIPEWDEYMDRFSGAVLLAEMLGWHDPEVQSNAWGEYFFDPDTDKEKNKDRFELLLASLRKNWGSNVAELLESAWKAERLNQCPSFGEWVISLNKLHPQALKKKQVIEKVETASILGVNEVSTDQILEDAKKYEDQGLYREAISLYENLLSSTNQDSLKNELEIVIQRLKTELDKLGKPFGRHELVNNDIKKLSSSKIPVRMPDFKSKRSKIIGGTAIVAIVLILLGTGVSAMLSNHKKTNMNAAVQEVQAKVAQEAKVKAEQAAKAKAAQEAKVKAEQAAKAKAVQEAKMKVKQAAKAEAAQEAKMKAKQAAKAKAAQEAKMKAEEEQSAQAKAAQEAKAEVQAAKAKAAQEAKVKAEQAAKAKVAQEAKVKVEQAAKTKAAQEAKVKAEQAAKAKAATQQSALYKYLQRQLTAYHYPNAFVESIVQLYSHAPYSKGLYIQLFTEKILSHQRTTPLYWMLYGTTSHYTHYEMFLDNRLYNSTNELPPGTSNIVPPTRQNGYYYFTDFNSLTLNYMFKVQVTIVKS